MASPSLEPLEKLNVNQLKAKITRTWGKYQRAAQRTMGPLLYHLRKKLKAQGKSGAGFGAWVEDNVDISRRTADRWADEWAIAHGLMKKPPKSATIRQLTKSKPSVDGKVTMSVSFIVDKQKQDEFVEAMEILGEDAEAIIFKAVTEAAKKKSHAKVANHTVAAHA